MKLLAPILSALPASFALLGSEDPLAATDIALPTLEEIVASAGAGIEIAPGIKVFDAWPSNDLSDAGVRICFDYAANGDASDIYRDSYCVASWSFKDSNGDPISSTFWSTTGWSVGSEAPDAAGPVINLQYPTGGLYEGDDRAGGFNTAGVKEKMVINMASTAASLSANFECFDQTGVTGAAHAGNVGMLSPFPNANDHLVAGGQLNVNGTFDSAIIQFPSPFPTSVVFHDDVYITASYDDSTGFATVTTNDGYIPYENLAFDMACDTSCPMSCASTVSVISGANTYTSAVSGAGVPSFTEA